MKLYSIDTGNMRVDGGALFGVLPKTIWQNKYNCDEHNLCNIKMRCLLIIDGNRKILIDTGNGNKQDGAFFSEYYLNGPGELIKSLNEKGFSPQDITDVIHTHLHFDHCGGTLKLDGNRIIPTFQNATLWVSKIQWDWAIAPNKIEAAAYPTENILPMLTSGRLKFIEDEDEILPNIFILFANGHTRGQCIPVINFKGKKIIFCADLMPTHANIPLGAISAYDLFPIETYLEKEKLLNMTVNQNMILFFEHDIDTECCTVKRQNDDFETDQLFQLADLNH